jgi:hypothetical protein
MVLMKLISGVLQYTEIGIKKGKGWEWVGEGDG